MLSGHLSKMRVELDEDNNNLVNYYLLLNDQELLLNQFLGKSIRLEYSGQIRCKNCQKSTKKSFSQGFCFPCMRKLAACDMCILKPELCHYAKGTCREPSWGEANCFVPHYVYLSNTSGLKVGITRHSQIPTRWIDQGATQATILFEVSNRLQSGLVEMTFKDLINDKTNWRSMLKENQADRDLISEAQGLIEQLQQKLNDLLTQQPEESIKLKEPKVTSIRYPILEFPQKIKSHNFDKDPVVEGQLMGIKGQYLILDTGVINLRKFTSYEVNFKGELA